MSRFERVQSGVIRALQFAEHVRYDGFAKTFGRAFFVNRTAVPVVKSLETAEDVSEQLVSNGMRFLELNRGNVGRPDLKCRLMNRQMKITRNIGAGYGAFAVAAGSVIAGELFFTLSDPRNPPEHEDIDLLFLHPGPGDVYMFDMSVDPQQRGGNVACLLMSAALYRFRETGFRNAYGYFDLHNIPALWVHRQLKFTELGRVSMSRLFLRRSSRRLS